MSHVKYCQEFIRLSAHVLRLQSLNAVLHLILLSD